MARQTIHCVWLLIIGAGSLVSAATVARKEIDIPSAGSSTVARKEIDIPSAGSSTAARKEIEVHSGGVAPAKSARKNPDMVLKPNRVSVNRQAKGGVVRSEEPAGEEPAGDGDADGAATPASGDGDAAAGDGAAADAGDGDAAAGDENGDGDGDGNGDAADAGDGDGASISSSRASRRAGQGGNSSSRTPVIWIVLPQVVWFVIVNAIVAIIHRNNKAAGLSQGCGIKSCLCCFCCSGLLTICFPIDEVVPPPVGQPLQVAQHQQPAVPPVAIA